MKLPHGYFLFTEHQHVTGLDLITDDKLSDFDNRFRLILHKHLTILVGWSILNCVCGLIALFIRMGSGYYFWMMSGVWGVINFAIAVGFFYHTIYRKFPKGGVYERLLVQNHVERMMRLNIMIDAIYIFVGFWLREHSFVCDLSYPNLWLGFGYATVVQGSFLLVQDIIIFRLHYSNFRKYNLF